MSRLARNWNQGAGIASWAAALFILWEVLAWIVHRVLQLTQPDSKLPYLHKVIGSMQENLPVLIKQGITTFGNSMTGFLIGSAFGFLLAVVMSLSKTVEQTLSPYMVASQMVPIIGLAPIIYGILHDPGVSRIVMSGYVTFFPVTINALRGLRSVQPEQLELMRSLAASTWQVYIKLKLPSALPGVFAGLKLSAPLAITASIIVELMGAPDGIGVLMVSSLYYGAAQVYMFWCTVLASIAIGFASYLLLTLAERWFTPWQPDFRASVNGRERA
ncbi:ABC transporter permease [Paenibacillus sedimenti]|uniref:ABC transporter permease n=1 Tax=Paenibacillus sedimenti TaxID=2770274 RepID=A0A926KLY7_9BACL|nr:ABC transporter permease [Paenibacillus sedimenti]MBD0380254.1 ABC transporter permease [Paenibacillus sedimenti]